jgi:hypothetical protein
MVQYIVVDDPVISNISGIPPSITVKLIDGRLYTGEMRVLSHMLESNDPSAYQWRKRERIEL